MINIGRRRKIRILVGFLLIAAAAAIIIVVLHYHTPKMIRLLERGNVAEIEEYIENEGAKGWFFLILLQIIETVSIVLPALPVYICAGVIFGRLRGFLMCYVTNMVMNYLIFVFARKIHTAMAEFSLLERTPKLEEWLTKTKRPARVVLIMCMLPIVPNGMIPYISAQTGIPLSSFMKALAVGCVPSIFFFVTCGDFLLSHPVHITLPVILTAVALIILFFAFRKKITSFLEEKIDHII